MCKPITFLRDLGLNYRHFSGAVSGGTIVNQNKKLKSYTHRKDCVFKKRFRLYIKKKITSSIYKKF